MKKTFKFVVSATMEWPESEMTEQRAHDYILSAIRDCYLNKLIEDGICDCDAEIEMIEVEDAEDHTTDRSLAMLGMERTLIDIVRENGEDCVLDLEDLDMKWTSECDGELYTEDITSIEIETTWDGEEFLLVHMDGGDEPFTDCDREDLGHNLADYIYEEVKSNY